MHPDVEFQQESADSVLRSVLDVMLAGLSRCSTEIDAALSSVAQLGSVLDRAGGVTAVRGCVYLLPLHTAKSPRPQLTHPVDEVCAKQGMDNTDGYADSDADVVNENDCEWCDGARDLVLAGWR